MSALLRRDDETIELDEPCYFGRSPQCRIIVGDTSVSRVHAVVLPTIQSCYVFDMKSRNGTFVNGEAITMHELVDGDVITVGEFSYTFHWPDRDSTNEELAVASDDAYAESDLLERALLEDTLGLVRAGELHGTKPIDRLLIIYKVGHLFAECSDVEELLNRMLDMAIEVMGADRGLVALASAGELETRVYRSSHGQRDDNFEAFSRSIALECFQSGESLLLDDPLSDPRFAASESIMALHIHSALCVPLRYREELLGVLYVDKRAVSAPFKKDDELMLTAIATQATMALSNSTLLAKLRESLRRLEEHQAALVRSERLAAMGLLSAGVAHEIRNPLAIIMGMSSLLELEHRADEKLFLRLGKVSKAAERINDITESLLGMSRERELTLAAVDPVEAIDDAISIIETVGTLKKHAAITIEKSLPADLPPVRGDGKRLSHVILNLVLNATQVLRESTGGVIAIVAHEEGDYVRLTVSDTGPGIDEAIRETLFEPLVTRGKEGGTGLGLWVTKRLVEDMEGTIELGSSSSAGTSFDVRLKKA